MNIIEIQLECAVEHIRDTVPMNGLVWDYEIKQNDAPLQATIRISELKWCFAIIYHEHYYPSGEVYWFIDDGHGIGNNYPIYFDWADPECLDIITDNFRTALEVLRVCISRLSVHLVDRV